MPAREETKMPLAKIVIHCALWNLRPDTLIRGVADHRLHQQVAASLSYFDPNLNCGILGDSTKPSRDWRKGEALFNERMARGGGT